MKRMKYIIFSIIALTIVSCAKDDFGGKDALTSFSQVSVGMADLATTRTHLGDNNAMLWDKGNSIGVYSDTQNVELYTLNQSDGGNASFIGNTVKGSKFYAFYPYSQDAVDTSNQNLLRMQLQNGWVNDEESSLPMIAISTTNSFLFKQVVGAIKISLTGKNKVTSITLKGNNGDVIAGKGTIDISAETPLLKLDADSQMTYSSISCDVDLNSDSPSVFYFPVPVMTLESGITIEIKGKKAETGEEFSIEKKSNEPVKITRATIKNFSGLDTDAILKQEDDQKILERQALIDLYNSTNGANWKRNDNWGSNKPLNEWYGVKTNSAGLVYELQLYNNNLDGKIPESIGNLTNLKNIFMYDNHLTGNLPNSIYNLVNLENLELNDNQFTGEISNDIGNLVNLSSLYLRGSLFTGSIPEAIGNLGNLKSLNIGCEQLSGPIPESICNLKELRSLVIGSGLSGILPKDIGKLTHLDFLNLYGCSNLGGEIPDSFYDLKELKSFCASFCNFSGTLSEKIGNLESLEEIVLCGNKLSGPLPQSIGNLRNLKSLMIRWNELSGELPASMGNMTSLEGIYLEGNNLTGDLPESFMNLNNLKWLNISGNCMSGTISEKMYKSDWWSHVFTVISQRDGYGFNIENAYVSTDYSQDGIISILQQHSKGNGIRIVITGDGFTDRLIDDGTFNKYANQAMEYFFDKEPYASFREYFDVYVVNAVSKYDILGMGTAFESKAEGDKYNWNVTNVQNYVRKINELQDNLSNVTTIIIINDPIGSTRVKCHMYSDGFTEGICTISENMQSQVNHEIGGHGFGLLADEYWDDDNTHQSTFTNKDELDEYHEKGWYLNVDHVSDPQNILWKDFINNADYNIEKIGVYEGGYASYSYGIYRPTDYSIMRDNIGEYNAPSRWSIYKRIMKLAGEEYSFESFLEYDKKNLAAIATKATTRNYVEKPVSSKKQLGAPPVFYNYPSSEIGKH